MKWKLIDSYLFWHAYSSAQTGASRYPADNHVFFLTWGMDTNSYVQSPEAVREEDGISQVSGAMGVKKQGGACRKIKNNPSLLI